MKVKTFTLYAHWATALLYGDTKSLGDKDKESLKDFLNKNNAKYSRFCCIGYNDKHSFSIPKSGGKRGVCLEFTFQIAPKDSVK